MTNDNIPDILTAHLFHLDDTGRIIDFRPSRHVQNHPLPTQEHSDIASLFPAGIYQLYMNMIAQLKLSNQTIHFDYFIEANENQHLFTAHGSKHDDIFAFIVMPASCSTYHDQPKADNVLATMLATIPTAIFWKNCESIYMGCSSKFASDTGLGSAEQVIGKTDHDLPWHEHADELCRKDKQMINAKLTLSNFENTLVDLNGHTRTFNISTHPLKNNHGKIIGIFGVYREIRLRREHTYMTRKMETLTHLTSGIAHDFNNILASILGYADLSLETLKAMGNQKEMMRYITEIIDEGEKARDLITQMLTFAQTNPDEDMALNPIPLIKEIAKVTQASLPNNINLSFHTDADIPKILISPSKLHQVILNLWINARDSLSDREGHIIINLNLITSRQRKCRSCNEIINGDFVEISMADDGKGIEDSLLDQIFNPPPIGSENNQKQGNGLAAAHKILHEHHGHIIVDSIKNYGTTVRLLLPPHH